MRIKSILRKAAERGLDSATIVAPTHPAERALMLDLFRFPEVVERTIDLRAPNHVAEYAYAAVGVVEPVLRRVSHPQRAGPDPPIILASLGGLDRSDAGPPCSTSSG